MGARVNAAGFVQEFCVVWDGGSSDWSKKYPNPECETIDLAKYNIPDGTEVWIKVHAIFGKTKESSEHVNFVRNNGNTAVYRTNGTTLIFKIVLLPLVINFEDDEFKKYLVEHFDLDGDGEISVSEAEKVEVINVELWNPQRGNIRSLKGIEYFKNLKNLNCSNHNISELNLSENKNLEDLWCHDNDIKSLDLSNNQKLVALRCWSNRFTSLDVSANPKFGLLYCNNIPSLAKVYVAKGQKIGELIKDPHTEIVEKDIPSGKTVARFGKEIRSTHLQKYYPSEVTFQEGVNQYLFHQSNQDNRWYMAKLSRDWDLQQEIKSGTYLRFYEVLVPFRFNGKNYLFAHSRQDYGWFISELSTSWDGQSEIGNGCWDNYYGCVFIFEQDGKVYLCAHSESDKRFFMTEILIGCETK